MSRWVLAFFAVSLFAGASAPAQTTRITSWNIHSKQFIDAPTFRLLPMPGTHVYRAIVTQGEHKWTVESDRPDVDLSKIWKDVAVKQFKIGFEWADADGKVIATEPPSVRVKAPDFAGFHEAPEDWRAAADRGTAFMIRTANRGKAPYREDGAPIWIWSASGPAPGRPDGLDISYPCLTTPHVIWAMLAHVKAHGPQSDEAILVAQATADWTFQHRMPANFALPLFQYSTVSHGNLGGGIEGESVNLLRANWFALGLIDLYEGTGKQDQRYLEYAQHIAKTTMRFQRLDGSFPYRVNGRTGAIDDPYTPATGEFALLVDALKPYGITDEMLVAQQRAVRWTLAYVVATHHWQAVFEDVAAPVPYSNLSQAPAQTFVCYLLRHQAEDPSYLPIAEKINRWIEDQFVDFGPESEAFARHVKGPMVFEQFHCWAPMEVHTAFWIDNLIALHRATGKQEYLDKAMAGGNAICAQQFDDGSFSTWGAKSWVDGKAVGEDVGGNWYNCNAMAIAALYRLDGYCRTLRAGG